MLTPQPSIDSELWSGDNVSTSVDGYDEEG